MTVTGQKVVLGGVDSDDTPTYYPICLDGSDVLEDDSDTGEDSDSGTIRCRRKKARTATSTILAELEGVWRWQDGVMVFELLEDKKEVYKRLRGLHKEYCA